MRDVAEKQRTFGFRFSGGTPEQLDGMLKAEMKRWADVARSASLVVQ
jgi:tripartite-type tricarboxylate transporter receptor subunit TctC